MNSQEKMTRDELKEILNDAEIPHDPNAKKAKLQAMVDEHIALVEEPVEVEGDLGDEAESEEVEATEPAEEAAEEPKVSGEVVVCGNLKHNGSVYSKGDKWPFSGDKALTAGLVKAGLLA